MIQFTEREAAVIFSVRAQPRASKSAISGELEGALKIRLAAPPVDGAANEELIFFLAKFFDLPRKNIHLLSGETSKHKIVQIDGISGEQFEEGVLAALARAS